MTMNRSIHRIVVMSTVSAIAFYAGVGARLAHAAAGDIFNLGTLGGTESQGYGINAAGQVTGYSYTTEGNLHAFRYDGTPGAGGAMLSLGTLGSGYSVGYGINAAGQVAGDSFTPAGVRHAFRYTGTPGSGGSMVDLGTLGGAESFGYGINEAGQVTGVSDSTSGLHAFRTAPNAVINPVTDDLGTLGGGTRSFGRGINAAGQVAGDALTNGDTTIRAFLYTGTPGSGGAMADLGTLGGTLSVGSAINDAGQVAGYSSITGDSEDHAFRYSGTPGSGGAMTDLDTLAGGTNSRGLAINDAGFVVGFSDRSTGGFWATLWQIDAGNTAVDLDAWLDATNPTQGAYWTLQIAFGINNNGLITGYGNYNDGPGGLTDGTRAYLLDASLLVGIPEPSTVALAGLYLLGLAARRAHRTSTR